jgi:pimeloyl-ACP methyl ester carboxylesterase
MKTSLITIPTDTLPLDGAWHLPDGEVLGAVLLFHGNTMNFYTGAPRFLPPLLTRLGFACLAFNRRGHDILSIRDSRSAEGAAFQLTHEAIADNRIAAAWLAERGYPAPVVIGHSNGGMLAVKHVADHPDTPALVLLSAHMGGKDQVRLSSAAGLMCGDRYEEIAAEAHRLVAAGQGDTLIQMPGWWYVSSAAALVDRMGQMPDIVALAPQITCPTLFVRGDDESPVIYPAEAFAACAGGPCHVWVVPGCDHFYKGREDEVAQHVAAWLAARFGLLPHESAG